MTHFILKIMIPLTLVSCRGNEAKIVTDTKLNQNKEDAVSKTTNNAEEEAGYLFVDIAKIYHRGGELEILDMTGKTLVMFKNKEITITGDSYDIIEEEHKYRHLIKVESYFPEYGLFILNSVRTGKDKFEIEFNGIKATITDKGQNLLKFKTVEEYVMDGYPNPTADNPLRTQPNESSEIIEGFENYSYLSVEIKGDWLKVKDNKDCYSGELPSENDIIGWVRWKKEGKLIIDIRHIC